MIYVAQLTKANGEIKKINSRPSESYLKKHPEFVKYYESGYENEFVYRTNFKIEDGKLTEVSDVEIHEREYH